MKRIKYIAIALCLSVAFGICSCSGNNNKYTNDETEMPPVVMENVSDYNTAKANVDLYMKSYSTYCKSSEAYFTTTQRQAVMPDMKTSVATYNVSNNGQFKLLTIDAVDSDNNSTVAEYYKLSDTDMFIAISEIRSDGIVNPAVKYYSTASGFYLMYDNELVTVESPETAVLYTSFAQIEEIYG